jgi:hypothetical protein
MHSQGELLPDGRAFKTRWFAKAARKAGIDDAELCRAVGEAMKGQCDDLGGGVFKKRLNKNMHRSIILAKGKKAWVFAYLFAKGIAPISIATSWSRFGCWRSRMKA